jgi:hypothetical protein
VHFLENKLNRGLPGRYAAVGCDARAGKGEHE